MADQCKCRHSLYDHQRNGHTGECLNCWCTSFVADHALGANATCISDYTSLSSDSSVLDHVIERLERKASPQGLNVLAEEFQWMGNSLMTYERLCSAVQAELRKPHPRLLLVSEGIVWFSEKSVPAGWSLFCTGMLPCFYREYPPQISWEKFDLPENRMPPPRRLGT
ncbi:MAG: hypothetical protein P4M01_01255 [Acidobacteriota bacterium]|nr:hypothetical protein [Acidobacteriota bacterium]